MQVKKDKTLQYLVRYPANYQEGEKYPLLLFFHGAGNRGERPEEYARDIFFTCTDQYAELPLITVAPMCEEDSWFDIFETLKEFVRHLATLDRVDESRMYIMGASMGGYCTWQLMMSLPEVFAAGVPICGGGMYWNAGRLKDLPVWAFHGALDEVVFPQESQKLVDSVNANGGNARLTIYPDCDHDSWTKTFEDLAVFAWLLEQQKTL